MGVLDYIEGSIRTVWEYISLNKTLITIVIGWSSLLGLYLLVKIICGIYRLTILYFWCQFWCKPNLKKKYGQWAVVTGGTDGIGLAIAKELAKRGHSIIIVSRNEDKLTKTKIELDQVSNVGQTLTIQADLSDSSAENYNRIKSLIDADNRDIGILVNNVGIATTTMQRFHHFDDDDLRTIVNINILATVLFTRMIIPGMLKRRRGLIINLSSIFGYLRIPHIHLYPATKSFISAFSGVLNVEFANDPIDIVDLTPGPVETKMTTSLSNNIMHRFFDNADKFARSTLNAASAGYSSYSGLFMQDIFESLVRVVPKCSSLYLTIYQPLMKHFCTNYQVSPAFERKSTQAIGSKSSNYAQKCSGRSYQMRALFNKFQY